MLIWTSVSGNWKRGFGPATPGTKHAPATAHVEAPESVHVGVDTEDVVEPWTR